MDWEMLQKYQTDTVSLLLIPNAMQVGTICRVETLLF